MLSEEITLSGKVNSKGNYNLINSEVYFKIFQSYNCRTTPESFSNGF